MTTQVSTDEVATEMSRLLERVALGEHVIIERDGKAVARIVPEGSEAPRPRTPGSAVGLLKLLAGWDDPLTERELNDFEGSHKLAASPAPA
jgi:antitoxin (DNA-binding transcriptional repressor) of toxin-antitoxin stability system